MNKELETLKQESEQELSELPKKNKPKKQLRVVQILLQIFKAPTIILIITSLIAAYSSAIAPSNTVARGWGVVVVMLLIVVVNVVLGLWQGRRIDNHGARLRKTPLQSRLRRLTVVTAIVTLVAGAAMFLFGIFVHKDNPLNASPRELREIPRLAAAIGAAAVPHTLVIVTTMALAYSVFVLAARGTNVKKVNIVETAGDTTLLCTEVTGVLTQNKLQVRKIWCAGHEVIDAADSDALSNAHRKLINMAAVCSRATVQVHDEYIDGTNYESETAVGDEADIAVIRFLHELSENRVTAERAYPRVYELESESESVTTVHRLSGSDEYIAITKGKTIQSEQARTIYEKFTAAGMSVVAISYKMFTNCPNMNADTIESEQVFAGLIGLIDPPRTDAADTVAKLKTAGVRTVVLTSECAATAAAIAAEVGISTQDDKVMTGAQLDALDEPDERALSGLIADVSVFAELSDENRARLVQAWSKSGETVTVVGSALNAADVNMTIEATSTDEQNGVSDIVITNNSFAVTADTVAVGRAAYDNIRKAAAFLIGTNIAETLVLAAVMCVLGLQVFTLAQILLINVVSCGIPAFFLAFESPESGVMRRAPFRKKTGAWGRIAQGSIGLTLLTLAAFALGSFVLSPPEFSDVDNVGALPAAISWIGELIDKNAYYTVGATMAFLVLSWGAAINVFNARSERSFFRTSPFENQGLTYAVFGVILFTMTVALIPSLSAIFNIQAGLTNTHWLVVIGLAFAQLVFGEVYKLLFCRKIGEPK
ncbi:MAG: cation transporting ATPase C-terminal domain-containing protein [Oscillospiraceae bacterium]|nr:cation transporting ATPase C-terminal domain-containing protein [Oscillospiraceae bacterium]